MPTLMEAWLAEQTAERLPWRHRPMSNDRPASGGAVAEHRSPDQARGWLTRWRNGGPLFARHAATHSHRVRTSDGRFRVQSLR